MTMRQKLEKQIEDLGPWFQNMAIAGVETAPDHFLGNYPAFKWEGFRHIIPEDLGGRSVLDIGCNAGLYSVEMKRRPGVSSASMPTRTISPRPALLPSNPDST